MQVTGNAELADEFRDLLDIVRPDWEHELAKFTGQSFAHEAGRFARGVAGWASRARLSLGLRIAEHLTEDSRDLAAPEEIQEFCTDVEPRVETQTDLVSIRQRQRLSLGVRWRDSDSMDGKQPQ